MKRTMLLAAYDAVESLASLSSRVESRFRSDKKRTLKSAPVVGHNGFRYRVHSDWGIPDEPSRYPVKDCHEMVVDSLGRIVLLTNHQKNNILIYNADGCARACGALPRVWRRAGALQPRDGAAAGGY